MALPDSFHDEISWMSKRMYLERAKRITMHVEACRFLYRTGMYDGMKFFFFNLGTFKIVYNG